MGVCVIVKENWYTQEKATKNIKILGKNENCLESVTHTQRGGFIQKVYNY